MWESVYQTAIGLGWVQWAAFICGLIYIGLASLNKISCWIFGILSAGLWAYAAYFHFSLVMDALLNVFYVIMGIVGWINWSGKGENGQLPITSLKFTTNTWIVLIGLVAGVLLGYLLSNYTTASLPYWDALTTIFSIAATFLLIRRHIDNWVYWIVTDAIYIGMYYYKGAYLFGILFIVYTLMAVAGWLQWKKEKAFI